MDDGTAFVFWIGRIRKALRRKFGEHVSISGITSAQFHLLYCLWQSDGVLTSELIATAGLDGGTITGVLDRLEAKGLIRRERSIADRRAIRIHLTQEGRNLERPVMQAVRDVNRLALEGIAAGDRAQLIRALEQVGDNLGA